MENLMLFKTGMFSLRFPISFNYSLSTSGSKCLTHLFFFDTVKFEDDGYKCSNIYSRESSLILKYFVSNRQAEITKCVVRKELTPENNWLSSTVESLKYFLTTVYVYVMKEP